MWKKLSLTEEEYDEVVVEQDWVEEVDKVGKKCLIGKLVLNKRANVEVMKNVLSTIWKMTLGMTVKEVGMRLYMFHFEDNVEKERVLMRQAWSFNKSLLVLVPFDRKSKPDEVNLQWCSFWI
ncbi:hypothetical protein CRYUN_Cryun34aG0088500 [Craigia yunnanensis]